MATIGRVVGTAGHIDHGKTALVRALTGIDTDRLKEEKERGITTELGFAHFELPGIGPVGVVDVPGHERFVRAMVAGAVGFDAVLLVVAADEGVMPQTREHLDICALLGLRRGVVALSKSDLATGELRELAVADVVAALAGGPLEKAATVPCSVKTGEGIDALRSGLAEALVDAPTRDPEGLARLPIDRVFTMKGFGSVATGTLWAGQIRLGDDLVALPSPDPLVAKVRGLQIHGAVSSQAVAGQRTAVNLTVPRERLERGQVLVHAGTFEPGRLLDVRVTHLSSARAPLARRSRLLLHAATAQVMAQVTLLDRAQLEPGESGLAQVLLAVPIVALPGDRFILRGFARQRHHGTTVGGGVVLRTLGARHRRATPQLIAALRECESASLDRRVELEVERAGALGLTRSGLHMRLCQTPKLVDAALLRLQSSRAVIRVDREQGVMVSGAAFSELCTTAVAVVSAFHAAHPLLPSMPREELRSRLHVDARLLHAVLEALAARGELRIDQGSARRPDHDPSRGRAESGLDADLARVEAAYRSAGLSPPRPAEAALQLGLPAAQINRAVDVLVRGGTLVRVKDLVFHAEPLAALRVRLVAHFATRPELTAQEWKEMVGATRKFAIPLAELFDAERLTLRVGDVRRLRTRPPL